MRSVPGLCRAASEECSASGCAVNDAGLRRATGWAPVCLDGVACCGPPLPVPECRARPRPAVETAQVWLRPVPLLGSLAGKAAEILYGITNYYTYTSAS